MIASLSEEEARAWATRQMGRVLFLWFLQAKQWLGEPGGMGSPTYLLKMWDKRSETQEGEYYRGILSPMFFDAMATGSSSRGEHPVLGLRSLPERRPIPAERSGGPHLRRRRGVLAGRGIRPLSGRLPNQTMKKVRKQDPPRPALPLPFHYKGVHARRPVRGPRPGVAGASF